MSLLHRKTKIVNERRKFKQKLLDFMGDGGKIRDVLNITKKCKKSNKQK